MEPNASLTPTEAKQLPAATGLALIRVTIGAMFVWVFFENLGKGLYTPAGYAGLINYYIKASHSPTAWKAVMGLAANHAAMAAPMQGLTEISLGVLLVIDCHPEISLLWEGYPRRFADGYSRAFFPNEIQESSNSSRENGLEDDV